MLGKMKGCGSSWVAKKCPRCMCSAAMIYQISKSSKNLGRPCYSCSNCEKFVRWAKPRCKIGENSASSQGLTMVNQGNSELVEEKGIRFEMN